jgi:hypothetical protein
VRGTRPFPKLSEGTLVVILCLLAAVRVFVYSAAFPFFNNVDEQAHFDLVVKYSRGSAPRKLEPVSLESRRYIALYGTPEYLSDSQQFPHGEYPPPLWTFPETLRTAILTESVNLPAPVNHESSQAPLYYVITALWFAAGRGLGLAGGTLLYWIRFLNVALVAGMVWLGYAIARRIFPEERFLYLGVPVLLAALPQDAFYSIQNDVLSPIGFGLVFYGLVQWLESEIATPKLGLLTGLAVGGVCLVKISNLPLLALATLSVLLMTWRQARQGEIRSAWLPLALFLLSAGLPIAGWAFWNLHNFGDITASAAKVQALGWAYNPIRLWRRHPIFTPGGLFYFWSELIARFWRGEFVWGLKPLSSNIVDAFYWISSALLTGAAAISLLPRFTPANKVQRSVLTLALASFFSLVGYLAFLSVAFDFQDCWYPSRAYPFFTSGRLLLGALIPFLIVYLHGLNWAMKQLRGKKLRWWLLAGIAVLLTSSQIALDQVAFSSPYNWFHLR